MNKSVNKEDVQDIKEIRTTRLRLFAECKCQRTVDCSINDDGSILLAAIAVMNEENDSQTVSVYTEVDGKQVFADNISIDEGTTETIPITVPVSSLQTENTHDSEVTIKVIDSDGGLVLQRMHSVTIRSKYDLDLTKLKERTAEFVNPLSPVIQQFVDDHDGPLAHAMGNDFMVSGYQIPDTILYQIKAAFNAVRDYGMHYVSDTITLNEGAYQRVRGPEKVLKDHSGNCIELSILFASILEAMAFEPVIVFPPGHAIIGVVMRTGSYQSSSAMPPGLDGKLIPLKDGRSITEVLCFESTMCPNKDTQFEQTVGVAHETIIKNLDWINSGRRFTLITEQRQRGIKPRLG